MCVLPTVVALRQRLFIDLCPLSKLFIPLFPPCFGFNEALNFIRIQNMISNRDVCNCKARIDIGVACIKVNAPFHVTIIPVTNLMNRNEIYNNGHIKYLTRFIKELKPIQQLALEYDAKEPIVVLRR